MMTALQVERLLSLPLLTAGLAASLLAAFVGLGAATAAELSDAAIAALIAFLAGDVILNVLKEEVPNERQSRFWAFALGMAS